MKALIFDLDGTLVDSVYAHTLAWQKALAEYGIPCPAWRRSGIASVGLLSGGFAEQDLYNAGAMRVYRDAAALHDGLNELGFY